VAEGAVRQYRFQDALFSFLEQALSLGWRLEAETFLEMRHVLIEGKDTLEALPVVYSLEIWR
jgi:hypothetical protein